MAGDWIKLEVTTPDKPEVVQMAQILKIDQDSVLGKCLRLWVWADQQTYGSDSCNALSVTETFLDRITYCPGFAAALRQVGWLEGRDGRLSIPNFDRHNGQTAKKRALTKKRVLKTRSDCNAPSVTKALPEREKEIEKRVLRRGDEEPASADLADASAPRCPYTEIAAAFDATFGTRSILTDKRRKHLATRWKDPWWREHWQLALERAGPSAFLRAANDRGWMIDLEFFAKPDTVAKILEGKYDDRQKTTTGPGNSAAAKEQRTASAFDDLRRARAEVRLSAGNDSSGSIPGNLTGPAVLDEAGS